MTVLLPGLNEIMLITRSTGPLHGKNLIYVNCFKRQGLFTKHLAVTMVLSGRWAGTISITS